MRNGRSAVGFVLDSAKLTDADERALLRLDAVRVVEGKCSTYAQDVYLFVHGSDDAACAAVVDETNATRIVYVGKPGAKTLAALTRADKSVGNAQAYVVESSVAALRVVWTSFDPPCVQKSPEFESRVLARVSEREQPKRKRRQKREDRPQAVPAPETSLDTSASAGRATDAPASGNDAPKGE